jgi:hypothetical protein
MDWDTVVKTVGISGILIGAIGYLIRSLFKQVLSVDLENHKHNLEKETERFRYELGKAAFEHQTRFSTLHVKRAVIIAELYKRLAQAMHHSSQAMVIAQLEGVRSQSESFKDASDSLHSLFEYFEANKIWFSESTCEKISNFSTELNTSLHRFKWEAFKLGGPYENWEAWKEVWEKVNNDIPSLKKDVENEFRNILDGPLDKAK